MAKVHGQSPLTKLPKALRIWNAWLSVETCRQCVCCCGVYSTWGPSSWAVWVAMPSCGWFLALVPLPLCSTIALYVSPVLEVARRRIQQDSHERFALQAEAESLRQTVEKIAMQVEDQQCLQQRTQDRFEALLKRHEQQLEAFRSEVTALKRQRSDVEVKRRQLDTEALAAERLWKAELQQLEEERWSLEKQLENLEEQMSSLAAPRQRAQDRCVELTEKLELLQPDLQKKETLRQTNLRIEGEIEDLEREIAQLEKRKKRPSRIGMNAKQHKKSTLR